MSDLSVFVPSTLTHFDAARISLEKASTIDEIKSIRDKAEALRAYAKQSGQSLEMQNRCAEIKLRAERRAGEILSAMEKHEGGRPGKTAASMSGVPTLEEIGISEQQSSRWQREATLPEEKFVELVDECRSEQKELTQSLLIKKATGAHVGNNSGENEWYTPEEYIDIARAVMGGIDIDPASHEDANEIIQAETYFTEGDSGLAHRWTGRIWMNCPYSQPLISQFCHKLCEEFHAGHVTEACVLVNNATETKFFQQLAQHASAICFPSGRVKFWSPKGEPAAPLQGQALIYFGKSVNKFIQHTKQLGFTVEIAR